MFYNLQFPIVNSLYTDKPLYKYILLLKEHWYSLLSFPLKIIWFEIKMLYNFQPSTTNQITHFYRTLFNALYWTLFLPLSLYLKKSFTLSSSASQNLPLYCRSLAKSTTFHSTLFLTKMSCLSHSSPSEPASSWWDESRAGNRASYQVLHGYKVNPWLFDRPATSHRS